MAPQANSTDSTHLSDHSLHSPRADKTCGDHTTFLIQFPTTVLTKHSIRIMPFSAAVWAHLGGWFIARELDEFHCEDSRRNNDQAVPKHHCH